MYERSPRFPTPPRGKVVKSREPSRFTNIYFVYSVEFGGAGEGG
jgi:hypothetical protein